MPRRIRLDFAAMEAATCDLTGQSDELTVATWRQRPRGANYATWGRVHPLSPHYTVKAGAEWLPVHPQPGGIGYRDWLGLVANGPDGLRLPAATVTNWRSIRQQDTGRKSARVLAAGYDMDNMKARGFVESEMPLPASIDTTAREMLDDMAARLVGAADIAARVLRLAVRHALFSDGATVKLDAELLSSARERLWHDSEHWYSKTLEQLAGGADRAELCAKWQALLHRLALPLFDEFAPITSDGFRTAPRISRARRGLHFSLSGFGKDGAQLFVLLGLPPAEARAKTKGRAA